MPDPTNLFFSAASGEFAYIRDPLAVRLNGRPDVGVKWQEHFIHSGYKSLDKLDDYLRRCHAVIHLIGETAGSVPPPVAVRELLADPSFAHLCDRQPFLRELLARENPGVSYTQWEAYLAIHHGLPVYVYHKANGPSAWDESQQAHFARLRRDGKDRGPFADATDLERQILEDVPVYLLAGPGARRPKVAFASGAGGGALAHALHARLGEAAQTGHFTLDVTSPLTADQAGGWLSGLTQFHLGVMAAPPDGVRVGPVGRLAEDLIRQGKLWLVALGAGEDRSLAWADAEPLGGDLTPLSEADRGRAVRRVVADVRLLAFERASIRDNTSPPPTTPRVSTERLGGPHPVGAGGEFVDRVRVRRCLSGAWQDKLVNVVVVRGGGGFGKTALLREWLTTDLSERGGRSAWQVFAYSFDAAGPDPDRFLRTAYEWFAGPQPAGGGWDLLTPWDRGARLAEAVRRQASVLVLDGFEHMLAVGPDGDGVIREKGVRWFVESLAGGNSGLLVLASRYGVTELAKYEGTAAVTLPVDSLPERDAAELLLRLGVLGTDDDRRHLARWARGQGLTLRLVASYLVDRYGGDPARADDLRLLPDDPQGGRVRAILGRYEEWIGDGDLRDAVRALALYNRPVNRHLFDRLRRAGVAGLCDRLVRLTAAQVQALFDRLVRISLATRTAGAEGGPWVEFHPLVREFVRERFRELAPDVWVAANRELFRHFRELASPPVPPATEEGELARLDDLYQACIHGCRAGRHQEVWADVFWPLVRRNDATRRRNYNLRTFGAFSADLRTLREFFDQDGQFNGPGLSPEDEVRITMEVGVNLRALGRLSEGEVWLRQALDRVTALLHTARGDQGGPLTRLASEVAGNLAELLGRLGDLSNARVVGEQGERLADASGDSEWRITLRGVRANVLHFVGQVDDARSLFAEAEGLWRSTAPPGPRPNAVHEFQYDDLLFSLGEYDAILARERVWPNASEHLMTALAALPAALVRLARDPSDDTRKAVRRAADHLQQAGRVEYQPRRYLATGEVHLSAGEWVTALELLKEGEQFCENHDLRLGAIDLHLAVARVYDASGHPALAVERRQKAGRRIRQCGYWIRQAAAGG